MPGNVSRDQTELNPRAEMICHQEMREIADQSPDEMTEPNSDVTDKSEVNASKPNHGTTLGQAEQRSRNKKDAIISASSNDMNTEGGEMSDKPRATTGEMSRTASLDQAEQESSYQKDDIISASSSALFTRNSLQCHTKK